MENTQFARAAGVCRVGRASRGREIKGLQTSLKPNGIL